MRKVGLVAIVLVIGILMSFVSVSFAETAVLEDQIHTSEPDELIPSGTDIVLPSASPSDPNQEPEPTAVESDPSAEPTEDLQAPAEPTADPSQTSEPAVPSPEPTEAASSEPSISPTETPVASSNAPSLEIASGHTIYLHQETPSIKVRWKHGVPSNVAGYVWSCSAQGASPQVFYVTYDPSSTTLAAGALNGHIDSPGTYEIRCQPVDAAQEPATDSARADLYVEQSSTELTIDANRSFPVPAGSELTLTAHVDQQSSDVVRYEWKPAGNSSGERSCTISSVAAGPVRYTCTAVLRSGQRVTGTLVVTGTELIATNRTVTLGADTAPLSAAWSNGVPEGNIHYSWSVRGESGTDLTQRGSIALPAHYLATLPARENPYTVSCQAYKGKSAIADPATFQVRVTADSTLVNNGMRSEKHIVGDENGVVPDTADRSALPFWAASGIMACLLLIGGALHHRSA